MRILLALDGSPSSIQARNLVASLSWPPGSVLRVVWAYEQPIDWMGHIGAGMPWVGDADDAVRDSLSNALDRLAAPLHRRGWQVETSVVEGRPAPAILQSAHALDAELIVLGSRGRGPLGTLLGSVSAEVANHATCPVLIARSDHVAQLLVATDGSTSARTIPAVLAAWGIARGLRAETLTVIPGHANDRLLAELHGGPDALAADEHQAEVEAHLALAEESARELRGFGVNATPIVRAGDPAHEIVDAATDFGTDLIVTGSRGRSGLESLLLGSVAQRVLLHAPCSVLILRAPIPARPRARVQARVSSPQRSRAPVGASV